MNARKLWKEIPKLPLTALAFYLTFFILWTIGIIPPPTEIVLMLETLYNNYGLLGLFISAFLEGIVYLGLYFPGSFIIALSVIISDGTFPSLLTISLVVALALTITSFINYFLGRHISFKHINETKSKLPRKISKGLILSMIHPNSLAFYFFDAGLEKRGLWKTIFVPIIMIPYGLALAYLFSTFRQATRNGIESPYVMISLILIWFAIAFWFAHKKKQAHKLMHELHLE